MHSNPWDTTWIEIPLGNCMRDGDRDGLCFLGILNLRYPFCLLNSATTYQALAIKVKDGEKSK